MSLTVRPARDDDSEFVWRLSMEPSVRDASVRHDEFTFEEHQDWWDRRFNDPWTKIYIGEVNGEPVGQVRYGKVLRLESGYQVVTETLTPETLEDMAERIAEISISILPEHRGHGYSSALLEQTEAQVAKALGVSTLAALVLPGNSISALLFQNAGYRYVREEIRLGKQVRRYEKEVSRERETGAGREGVEGGRHEDVRVSPSS